MKKGYSKKQTPLFLQEQSKEELIDFIEDLAERHKEVKSELALFVKISTGKKDKIAEFLKKEIMKRTSTIPRNPRTRQMMLPKHSIFTKVFEYLLKKEYYDVLLEVGKYFFQSVQFQLEVLEEHERLRPEIGSCMQPVFQALPESSLSIPQQIEYIGEMIEIDKYFVLNNAIDEYINYCFSPEQWKSMASALEKILQDIWKGKKTSFAKHGGLAMDLLIISLKNCHREDEVIPLCIREAEETGNYLRLIYQMIQLDQPEDALPWMFKGYEREYKKSLSNKNYHNGLEELEKAYEKILIEKNEQDKIIALYTHSFFRSPSLVNYINLEKQAKETGYWETIRKFCLEYLNNGKLPFTSCKTLRYDSAWNLPPTGLEKYLCPSSSRSFPAYKDGLEIALHTGRPEEVIDWLDRWTKELEQSNIEEDPEYEIFLNKAVDFLWSCHPGKSLEIMKQRVEYYANCDNLKDYDRAIPYLDKIKNNLKRNNQKNEWDEYVQYLLNKYKRKKLFILKVRVVDEHFLDLHTLITKWRYDNIHGV